MAHYVTAAMMLRQLFVVAGAALPQLLIATETDAFQPSLQR